MLPLIKHYLGDPGSLFHVRATPSQGRPSGWRRGRRGLAWLDSLVVGLTQLGHKDLGSGRVVVGLPLLLPLDKLGEFEGPPSGQSAGAGAGVGLLLARLIFIFPLLARPS